MRPVDIGTVLVKIFDFTPPDLVGAVDCENIDKFPLEGGGVLLRDLVGLGVGEGDLEAITLLFSMSKSIRIASPTSFLRSSSFMLR